MSEIRGIGEVLELLALAEGAVAVSKGGSLLVVTGVMRGAVGVGLGWG